MSADEDTELRDLVAQTLETNGTLSKIRAQLRASVFLALEEQESVQNKTPFLNKDLALFLSTKEGRHVASLVRNFLEFFDLEFTLAVFDPETGLGPDYERSETLARELSLPPPGPSPRAPLLSDVLQRSQQTGRAPGGPPRSTTQNEDAVLQLPKDLTPTQISAAREKFEQYDCDDSGAIEKDELRELFTDVFPHFHKNMLDRYVNDEFKAVDRNFSSSIDFEEFLEMYKRLFLLCRTVVSGEVEDILQTAPKKPRDQLNSPMLSKSSIAENKSLNSLEAKNQKNLESSKQPPSEASNGPKHNSLIDLGSDVDGDPFFDDPASHSYGNRSIIALPPVHQVSPGRLSQIPVSVVDHHSDEKNNDLKMTSNGGSGGGTNMSSLQGLPPLTPEKPTRPAPHDNEYTAVGRDSNLRSLDRGMADMELGDGHDEFSYEEDFQESNSITKKPVHKSDPKSPTENGGDSIAEEIEEEDLDDFSIEGDKSAFDDMTTDKSISQADGGFDYAEEVGTAQSLV